MAKKAMVFKKPAAAVIAMKVLHKPAGKKPAANVKATQGWSQGQGPDASTGREPRFFAVSMGVPPRLGGVGDDVQRPQLPSMAGPMCSAQ